VPGQARIAARTFPELGVSQFEGEDPLDLALSSEVTAV
jgi:hypothetical protein